MKLKKQGFTLIELVTVIFIIGLFLGLSFPMLGSFIGNPIKGASRKLAGVIKNLYYDAVFKNKRFKLNYDIEANLYWVSEDKEYFEYGEKEEQEKLDREKGVTLPKGVVFLDIRTEIHGKKQSGTLYTTFYSDGWMDKTEIRLQANENIISLFPESETGKVEIENGYVEREEEVFEQGIYSN